MTMEKIKQLIIKIPEHAYRRVVHNKDDMPEIVRDSFKHGIPLMKCKACKFFERDSFAKVDGIPIIVAHEICSRWGGGCKTSEEGYCYLFERRDEHG